MHHAVSSAKRYGGEPADYLSIHQFFDQSKQLLPDIRHRALLDHTWGIYLAEQIFGATITTSSGRIVPTRFIGWQLVKEDLLRIPIVPDWLECLAPQPWMLRRGKLMAQMSEHVDHQQLTTLDAGVDVVAFSSSDTFPRSGEASA
jgi:hypothetical protein